MIMRHIRNTIFSEITYLVKKKDIFLKLNECFLNLPENVEKVKLIYLGTDAHYSKEIVVFKKLISLLNGLDYSKERILNCDETLIK